MVSVFAHCSSSCLLKRSIETSYIHCVAYHTACDMAHKEISAHGDVQRSAESLTRNAIDKFGSRDNVTVLIALLR